MLLITTKRYVITTSAVNCFGFRALTTGGDISQYENNPILLVMHKRDMGYTNNLPPGKAVEIQIEGDALTCRLAFDSEDPYAVQLYNKYESGILSMLSAGLKPLEVSDEPELLILGQTGPTITKWVLVEVSLVDIGANPEAYAVALYDADDKIITLSAETIETLITKKPQKNHMKIVTLSAPNVGIMLAALKLNAETVTEAELVEKVSGLVTLSSEQAAKIITLTSEKDAEIVKLSALKTKYDSEIKLANDAAIKTLVDNAVDKKMITRKDGDNLIELAEGKIESVKKFLEGKTPSPSVKDSVSVKDGEKTELVKLSEMSFDDLHKSNKLVRLKELDAQTFNAKFKEKYGTEPKNQ